MSSPVPLSIRLLQKASAAASLTWPLARRLFPERLDIDPNRSFWAAQTPGYQPRPPLARDLSADIAVIGGGFTGTSAAYHLSRRFPEKRVVLLEAASLANGASGRNGGLVLNWVNGVYGDEHLTRRVYEWTSEGIRRLDALIKRHSLDVDFRLDGTLSIYTDPARAEAANREVEEHQRLGIPEQFIDGETLRRDLDLKGAYGAIYDPNSGQMNGAQLVRSLRDVLLAQGVEIYEGTPVLKVEEGRKVRLLTPRAEVTADALVIATNGYSGKLGYFHDAMFPLHSHIFALEALSPEEQAQIGWRRYAGFSDDLDRIAYASLTSDGHLIFGGGSNASYAYLFRNRTAFPGSPHTAGRSFRAVEQTLHAYLPATRDKKVIHRWTGTLAITLDRKPLIGVRGEHQNVYYALGYSGHGVTLANMAGEILADLYEGDDEKYREFPFIRASYTRIPPEPFRWLGYNVFTRLTGKSPRV